MCEEEAEGWYQASGQIDVIDDCLSSCNKRLLNQAIHGPVDFVYYTRKVASSIQLERNLVSML